MSEFNSAEAKAGLSELVENAVLGEEVIVTKDNRPVAKIVPLHQAHVPGTGKGQILYIAPDFDAPLEDFNNSH